jgi:transposase
LLKEGRSQTEVGKIVGASQASVSRWQKAADEHNGAVPSKPHPGRNRLLTDEQHQELEALLAKGATAFGWTNDLWTSPRVRQLICDHFGVDFHVGHVRKMLVARLGWTSQKPERRARERNEEEIERWRTEDVPRLKKTPGGGEQHSFSSTNQASCSLPSYVEPSRLAGKHRFTAAGIAAIVSPPSVPSR